MNFTNENKFFAFMSLLGDLMLLNVLFLLTSLPLLTFGTSSCALYASVQKRLRGEESYPLRDYMRAWRDNLKNGLCIWLLLLLPLTFLLLLTSYIAKHLDNLPVIILYSFLFIWLSFTLLYAFPLQATFINTPLRIIKNSILTALRHLPWTLLLFFATFLPLLLTLVFPKALPLTAVYWLLIGGSLQSVCASVILKHVFVFYMPEA